MTKVVDTAIKSNLSPTEWGHQDPITVAIPPPLTPESLDTSRSLADDMMQELPLDTSATDIDALDLSSTQQALTQADFAAHWEDRLSEAVIDEFVHDGFIVLDDVYEPKALLALQAESGFVDYRDALLTEGVRKTDIRGDRIRWITNHFFAGFYYLNSINELGHLFNRLFFAGIRHSEAHYACYPPGFGYKWHADNPVGRDERVISAVFYLNDEWTPDDGGELSIIDNHGQQHQFLPKANRLVLFESNLRHQVEIAHRQRYSIATWLRRDDAVIIVESL